MKTKILDVALIGILAIAVLIIGALVMDIIRNPSACRGLHYDYYRCRAERMEVCLATEKFSREECLKLMTGGQR